MTDRISSLPKMLPLHRAVRGLGLAVALTLTLAMLPGFVPAAHAEKADRDKPLNIEADKMHLDDLKQVTVFTGKVLLTKGTIIVHADRLVLTQDPEGYQYATAYGTTGKPASFRQKREGVDQYVEGYADQLDYDGKTEIVRLKKHAILRRLEGEKLVDEVCGNLVVYESLTEIFTADSGPAGTCNPSGRVKLVIQPRSPAASATATPPAAAATPGARPPAKPAVPANPADGAALKFSDRPNSVK